MPSRSYRRKQSAKNRKSGGKGSKFCSKAALRANAEQCQNNIQPQSYEATGSESDSLDVTNVSHSSQKQLDVAKLQELFPNMTSSIIAEVLSSCNSVVEAGGKLDMMDNPGDTSSTVCHVPTGVEGKIAHPPSNNSAEYPELCSTVESAWDVVSKKTDKSESDVGEDFVMVTEADVTDWCVIDSKDVNFIQSKAKTLYAAMCS